MNRSKSSKVALPVVIVAVLVALMIGYVVGHRTNKEEKMGSYPTIPFPTDAIAIPTVFEKMIPHATEIIRPQPSSNGTNGVCSPGYIKVCEGGQCECLQH